MTPPKDLENASGILSRISDAFFALDQDLIVTYFNPAAERQLGKSREEVLGRPLFDAFPEARASIFEERYRMALETREPDAFEIYFDVEPYKGWYEVRVYPDESGLSVYFQVVTQRKEAEEELRAAHEELQAAHEGLRHFEWLLEREEAGASPVVEPYDPPYSDVTALNSSRVILDAVGPEALEDMGRDLLALLDTSVAVYEANGDYAFGLFSSGWCRLMDSASFALCGTRDTKEALACGEWLCHENCWRDSGRAAMVSGAPTDIQCVGGIHLYAVPIRAHEETVGVVNMGYGTPPRDQSTLEELSRAFHVDLDELRRQAESYQPRPRFIIEMAKRRCEVMARMIGQAVERRRYQEEVLAGNERLRAVNQQLLATEQQLRATNQQLEAANQQLMATNRQLEAANQQLEATNQQLRASEEERRRGEDLLERTGEMARVGGWEVNLEDSTVYWSSVTKLIHEVPEDYVSTVDEAVSFFHPDDVPTLREALRLAMEEGKPYDLEIRFITAKGRPLWTRTIGRSEFVDGKCQRLWGTFQDITERKEAELALRASERRYRMAQELSGLGVWTWDLENGEVEWSDRQLELLGVEPGGFQGTFEDVADRIHPDDLAAWSENVRACLEEGKEHRIDFRVLLPEGGERWLSAFGDAQRNETGEPIRMSGVLMDITGRKEAERELAEKNALLEESHRALRDLTHRLQAIREQEREELARDLHDEVGEVLTVHRMDLDQLRREAEQAGNPIAASVPAILESADKVIEIVREYCMQLHSPVLDLMGVAAAIRSHAEVVAEKAEPAFQIDVTEENLGLGPEVEINLFRIAQEALTNVLRHASAEQVQVRFGPEDNGRIVLEIIDNGVGIGPEPMRSGRTLGLLGMRERAMAIGGHLTVQERDEGGTEVRLVLPTSR